MRFSAAVTALVMIMLLGACEKTVINRGYIVESAEFGEIVVGKDNASSVFEKFGSPTMRSSLVADDGSYSWYYVSKRAEKSGFLDPKITAKKTVVVTFSNNDLVRSVSESTRDDVKISTVSETTKTGGKGAGIVGETFGGLGKYMKRYQEKDKS